MAEGKVKWFDDRKGYGFITQDDGTDIFLHYSDIDDPRFQSADQDDRVLFTVESTRKGLRARDVQIIKVEDE